MLIILTILIILTMLIILKILIILTGVPTGDTNVFVHL